VRTIKQATIIGGGLAGSEAAYQVARRGVPVRLYEMRPERSTPVHQTGWLAELVCSNSLKSEELSRGGGVLKAELRRLDSLVMRCADATRVPAGSALAVDRDRFAQRVTEELAALPEVTLIREEVTEIPPEGPVIVASGPLTSARLSDALAALVTAGFLHFYDAVSPIVETDSLDPERLFEASRYEHGEGAYLNCTLTEAEYDRFRKALIAARRVPLRDFEKKAFFEGCLPVEELAQRGRQTLAFGPLKPVGLVDPRTGERPFAVVQLRAENEEKTRYNLVGCQTRLLWSEQQKVFRLIPALREAEFVRYGVVHRNTYLNGPRVLSPTLQCRKRPDLLFAGQLTGVEGYVESTGSGLVAGINAACLARGLPCLQFPRETVLGALAQYVAAAETKDFQPMNANFGLLPPLATEGNRLKKKEKYEALAKRALDALDKFVEEELTG